MPSTTPTPTRLFLRQCAVIFTVALSSDAAYAQVLGVPQAVGDSNSIQQVMCNVILIMTGTTGKAIATVCIIGLGAGALFGRVSWNAAMLCVLGVGLLFGAASIVADLGAGGLTLVVGLPGGGGLYGGGGLGNNQFGGPDTCQAGSLIDNWAQNWNTGALEKLVATYAPDAVYLPPHHEAVHGRDSIRDYLRVPRSHGVSDLAFDVTYIKQSGDVAWDVGTYRMSMPQNGSIPTLFALAKS